MMYTLEDLLTKMGAPEARERGRIEWHYFDPARRDLGGRAEVRLEAGGERLIAEMKQMREKSEDDDASDRKAVYTDTFYLSAERTARPGHYRITKIAFDGEEYDRPKKAVIELGLSMFHARALDISIRMVEQLFNRQDITDPAVDPKLQFKRPATPPRKEAFGIVVPFRPRVVA